MTRSLALLLVLTLWPWPLLAQTPAPDLSPLWQAIQGLAVRQGATEARVQTLETQLLPLVSRSVTDTGRIGALEARVVVLESKPAGPSPVVAVFSGLWGVLTNPIFLGAVGAFVACNRTGKC